jgi:hypothetical protein
MPVATFLDYVAQGEAYDAAAAHERALKMWLPRLGPSMTLPQARRHPASNLTGASQGLRVTP